jgi:hypothetical protein
MKPSDKLRDALTDENVCSLPKGKHRAQGQPGAGKEQKDH